MSAFLADHVAIYEEKLFVEGGVWDWLAVPGNALPHEEALTLALILQIAADDRGTQRSITVVAINPSGARAKVADMNVKIDANYRADHVTCPLSFPMRFQEHGRHVFMLETGDGSDTFSVPLKIIPPDS